MSDETNLERGAALAAIPANRLEVTVAEAGLSFVFATLLKALEKRSPGLTIEVRADLQALSADFKRNAEFAWDAGLTAEVIDRALLYSRPGKSDAGRRRRARAPNES